ncbi:restriction modification system DNA specificity domain protein [Sulfurimonas autotrophica DSM 16294]|uniref:Restriction modification system DNA specificity domain protein n=2 Tax=Sulfurimonas autotrophica TaxID=202747 RepID=E0UTU8_SULAO|nr:restriction modification system DNA specificity domain protein [Sulfurimonas autotrophica DSM 16294]
MRVTCKVPELRFAEFSGEWDEKQLIELSKNGFSNGAFNDPKKAGHGYRIINVKDMYIDGRINISNLLRVALDEKEFLKNRVEYGDIFFTRSSLVKEGIAYSNINLNNANDLTFDGHLIRMRPNKQNYSPLFLYYNFTTLYARKQFIIRGKTTTMTTIGQEDIASVKIVLPSKLEQEKIAFFLSSVDSKIEQLSKKKTLLEQYKKGVMQKIFSQELRFKDDDESEFPEWVEKQLGDFLILTLRKVPKPTENYLAIGIRSHCKGTFQKPDSEPHKIAMEKLFLVKENDLIVSITFAWESAIAIVKKEDKNGLVSHRFPTYTFDEKIATHEFFKYVIIQKKFRFMLDLISPGGAGRNRVMSKKDFLTLKWNMPCIKEQTKIANFLSSLDKKIALTNKELDATKEFKKALLQKMFV